MRLLISAGEPSGDLYGALLAATLRERCPGIEIEAFGGPALAGVGVAVRWSMEGRTVLGFVEILRAIPSHWTLLRTLDRELAAGRYDLVVPIDYPGFNLRLAERAHRHGVPVLYYIAPKHWSSRTSSRLTARLARAITRMACILPFEPAHFSPFGIAAEFVGHPLRDLPQTPERSEARQLLGIAERARVVALFPGSRRQEVARLWEPMIGAARILLTESRCDRVLVAAMPGLAIPNPGNEGIHVVAGRTETILGAADAAIVKSGTATLQAALADVPMVVTYRVHPITAALARRMIRVPWISLPNLIAGRAVVPELLQESVSARRLADAVHPLLDRQSPEARAQREGFAVVRERVVPGATLRVAAMVGEILSATPAVHAS